MIWRRTSEIGAAHLMVTLTMTDAPTHGLPGHADVGAGVVGPLTNDQAVLVGIITRGVTGRRLGQLPTLTADSITIGVQGAALPAAVFIPRAEILFIYELLAPPGAQEVVLSVR